MNQSCAALHTPVKARYGLAPNDDLHTAAVFSSVSSLGARHSGGASSL
jgi:hypothetical protein